jgi:8-oxo-dGTP pyrophosphatase MutT (NUDIX family)
MRSWSLPDQCQLLDEYRELLEHEPLALERGCRQGHFTSSALLCDPGAGQIMLLMHPKVGRWLQFGGHIESADNSFAEAALRECREESGYRDIALAGDPLAIDRHKVPCAGNQSVHWDIQYVATVDQRAVHLPTEDLHVQWFDIATVAEEIPELDLSVSRLIAAAGAIIYPQ